MDLPAPLSCTELLQSRIRSSDI